MHFTKLLTNIELGVLREVWHTRGTTRASLERALMRSRPTVEKALQSLQSRGLIVREGKISHTRGRPAETFDVRRDAWSALGIDFEMPDVDAVLVDAWGERIDSARFIMPREVDDSRIILEGIAEHVRSWILTLPAPALCAVGVGFPGYFAGGGLSLMGANMPAWRQVPARVHLERLFSVPVVVGHDVHFMALAEIEHRGWGEDVVLYCALRPGLCGGVRIGACLAIRGQPYAGGHGNGGALFRALVSPEALAAAGSETGRTLVIAERVVASLVHAIPMTDPDHIVFHGGDTGSLELAIIERCEQLLQDALRGEYVGFPKICPAVIRGASGAQRAALAATRALLSERNDELATEKGG